MGILKRGLSNMCDYCNGESMVIMGTGYDDICLSIEKHKVWNYYNLILSYRDENDSLEKMFASIKYCPFCGRKLED